MATSYTGPGAPKYPWDNWIDGEKHTVKQGVDFTCAPSSFQSHVRREAAKRGYKAVTDTIAPNYRYKKPVVNFQFLDEDYRPLRVKAKNGKR